MNFNFRVDTTTLAILMSAIVALLLMHDIHAHHQVVPASTLPMTQISVQDRVVTKEFLLTDDSGQTRARIGMNELNAPALSLYDRGGQQRALVRLNRDDVPSLRLFDQSGTLRGGMGFTRGTLEPHLWFFDQDGSTSETLPSLGTLSLNYFPTSRNYTTRSHGTVILWDAPVVSGIKTRVGWISVQSNVPGAR